MVLAQPLTWGVRTTDESPWHFAVGERRSANTSEGNVQDAVRTTFECIQLNELARLSGIGKR